MTLSQAIDKVMILLDETEVGNSDIQVNVADYTVKLPDCFDSIQRELATNCKPIKKYLTATTTAKAINKPNDLFEVISITDSDGYTIGYEENATQFLFDEDGEYTICYKAYPTTINSSTPSTYSFEIDNDCQEIMIYGVCMLLTINDDTTLYSIYRNEYENGMANIIERLSAYPKGRVLGGVRI